jgi:hypothetical protein
MGLKKRLLATLPSNKWCGCDHGVEEEESYQFRVRANDANTEGHRFQIRRKRTCNNCEDDAVTVVFEDYCEYNPERGTPHERRVGIDEDEMVDYGFVEHDEMAKMLVEMRLSDSLNLQ